MRVGLKAAMMAGERAVTSVGSMDGQMAVPMDAAAFIEGDIHYELIVWEDDRQ